MKIVLLMGFEYQKEKYLPGIQIDLYHAYSMALNMKADKIIILTDIDHDDESKTPLFIEAITQSKLDPNIFTFIENLKSKKQLIVYQNRLDLISHLSSHSNQCDQLFFYFTGHGKNEQFILPDSDHLSMNVLREILCNSVHKNGDIFLIIDCCNVNGFNLPYQLIKKDIDYIYKLSKPPHFVTQRIICISSSLSTETSGMTKYGSIFSTFCFDLFKHHQRSLPKLLHSLNDHCSKIYREYNKSSSVQTSTIFSSYPNLFSVWSWLYHDHNIDISYDHQTCTVQILDKNLILKSNTYDSVCFLNSISY